MDWGQYVQTAVASTSIFFCFCTFYVYFTIKGFRLRIANLFIVFQQISNLLLSMGKLLEVLKPNIVNNQCFIEGVLIQSGIISSITWLNLLSLYYYLRYYLKFIHIGRYIMCLLVAGIVFPIFLSILDITILRIESVYWCEDWMRFNLKYFVEPGIIFATFVFQLIISSFLLAKYKKGGISTFKVKFAYFDLILMVLCFGPLEIFSGFEYFELKIEVLRRVAEVLLASTGAVRFLLSDCIPQLLEYKEAKDFGALTEHLNKIKYKV
jgi:hypothetical protein